jgi:hypothetical protein
MGGANNLPHAEVLREAEPRSTHSIAPIAFLPLRGNADWVGIAPQDEGVCLDWASSGQRR